MSHSCLALILAAGEGTRMRSNLPKVMHPVAGLPLLGHVLETVKAADCETVAVVAGTGFEMVSGFASGHFDGAEVFEQKGEARYRSRGVVCTCGH